MSIDTCLKKKAFKNIHQANLALAHMWEGKDMAGVVPYNCPYCRKVHLGTATVDILEKKERINKRDFDDKKLNARVKALINILDNVLGADGVVQ